MLNFYYSDTPNPIRVTLFPGGMRNASVTIV